MLLVFALVVLIDQLAKAAVVACLEEGASTSGTIFGVRFRHVINRRQPWASTGSVRVLIIMWLLLISAALIVATRINSPLMHAALGALIGGATGNLLDGISRNAVTDFIDLRVWPVFNVADAAIVTGAVALLWIVFRFRVGV